MFRRWQEEPLIRSITTDDIPKKVRKSNVRHKLGRRLIVPVPFHWFQRLGLIRCTDEKPMGMRRTKSMVYLSQKLITIDKTFASLTHWLGRCNLMKWQHQQFIFRIMNFSQKYRILFFLSLCVLLMCNGYFLIESRGFNGKTWLMPFTLFSLIFDRYTHHSQIHAHCKRKETKIHEMCNQYLAFIQL